MLEVSKNRHRWREWIDDVRVRDVLDEAAKGLKWAWTLDKKSPQSYPVNTWWLFVQIEDQLKHKPVQRTHKLPSPPRPPQKFADLLEDRTIRGAYEDHNEGSYEEALRKAAKGYDEGYAAWRKIMHAVDLAYVIMYYGIDFAPQPRVRILHRSLLEIVDSEHLRDLSLEGIAELFDDVCPCGKKHQPDAIRKLRKRRAGVSQGNT